MIRSTGSGQPSVHLTDHGLLVLALGLIPLLIAIGVGAYGMQLQQKNKPVNRGLSAQAVVVDVDERKSNSYIAVLEYKDRKGESYRMASLPRSERPALGDEVTVSYSRNDPSAARDVDAPTQGTQLAYGGFIAALMYVLSLFVLVSTRREFVLTELYGSRPATS